MEVHFCDICNESVPARDLDQGRAFLRKGRVVCAACDAAMGAVERAAAASGAPAATAGAAVGPERYAPFGGDPDETPTVTDADQVPAAAAFGAASHPHAHAPAATASAGSGLAMVLAAMGILLTASVAVLLFERLDESGRSASVEVGRMRGELRGAMDDLRDEFVADAQSRTEETRRIDRALVELSTREEERARAAGESVTRLSADLLEMKAKLDASARLAADVARNGLRVDELAATIEEMRGDIGLIAEKVLELEERPAVVQAAPAGDAGAKPVVNEPAWAGLVADLQSPSSGARWAAVTALGDTQDPAVVPHLVPMLTDTDLFVRMATARVLGDLGTLEAVPALIDALEDDEASVREQAVVSLRALTGERFKFDPTANEAERAKRVKAWRDWWRRDGEKRLAQA